MTLAGQLMGENPGLFFWISVILKARIIFSGLSFGSCYLPEECWGKAPPEGLSSWRGTLPRQQLPAGLPTPVRRGSLGESWNQLSRAELKEFSSFCTEKTIATKVSNDVVTWCS